MPAYVVLYRFTDQGRKNIKNSVKRAQEDPQGERATRFQGRRPLLELQGRYDLVQAGIVEAPSEDAMMTGLFGISEAGNVSSETMRAFTDEEMQKNTSADTASPPIFAHSPANPVPRGIGPPAAGAAASRRSS